MRVAFFGGTFDPPHRGHIALVRLARERLSLDRILVAPVAVQPLKQQTLPASFADRVAMTRLAFTGEPAVEVSLIDAPRPGDASNYTPNYTIDTLHTLRSQLAPADTLFCILGADSFLTIRNWHRAADLLLTCDFIVGARPGFDLAQAASALPLEISAMPAPSQLPHMRILDLTARNSRLAARLYLLTGLAVDVSATHIRAALTGKADPGSVLNPAVVEYIHSHHLYEHL